MTDVEKKLEVIRKSGQVGIDLLECETPPVSRYTEENEDGVPIFEEDERYWDAWTRIRGLVEEFGEDGAEVERWPNEEMPFLSAYGARSVGGENFAQVTVNYVADGSFVITLEYRIDGGWATYISERAEDLTVLDIGRQITGVELALLANELESPAETLDYWMTNVLYGYDAITQSSWAKIRKASRQTVSDRVRAARGKLGVE